jgi:hypothetical protein
MYDKLENIKKPQFSDEVTYHTYVVDQCKQPEDQNVEKKIKNIIIQELKNENKSTVKETEKKVFLSFELIHHLSV